MTAIATTPGPQGLVDDALLAGPLEELVTLWRRVDELPQLPQASRVTGEAALKVAAAIAQVRAAADALLAPYAARVEELSRPGSVSRFARWKGFPSAAALLSHVTGLSVGEAGKLIGVGRVLADADAAEAVLVPSAFSDNEGRSALAEAVETETASAQPAAVVPPPTPLPPTQLPLAPREVSPLAAAIRAGWLGTEMATIIRRTLEDMMIDTSQTEQFLVDAARETSITELRRLCLETLAERDPAGYAAREARQQKARFLKFFEEPDGMVGVFGKLRRVMRRGSKVGWKRNCRPRCLLSATCTRANSANWVRSVRTSLLRWLATRWVVSRRLRVPNPPS